MNRRDSLRIFTSALAGAILPAPFRFLTAAEKTLIMKKIPSTGQMIPVVGMGTWITFNVGKIKKLRDERTEVLRAFFKGGGELIDSSPMYGSSEEVLGYALDKLKHPKQLFAATKVWTSDGKEGREQVSDSLKLWQVSSLELEQIHNLLNWQEHLKYLRELKEKKQIKYIGITTSHSRRHDDLAKIMQTEKLDFVQLTYNIENRAVEDKLLDLAMKKNIALIANRPFGGGQLIERAKKHKLPSWAKDEGITSWSEYLLKFVTSHPAITCAIPATSKVSHMQENMAACRGTLPSEKVRQKMAKHFASL